jgi:hypothetical protein
LLDGGCVKLGLQFRVEYLRTTRGKKYDFRFDPDFPERLRKPSAAKEMTGASLNSVLRMVERYRAPATITLDGGVWADSKFSIPEYDVVDWLEQDPQSVQWNQLGRPEADDALQNLPGSIASPQLARMMSLNRYNTRFLAYKKRNLQAAARLIAAHNRQHPESLIAVNLDPDEYINPWFINQQWYDYNPDTLRQFREWLLHAGAYADGGELAASRCAQRHDLASLRLLSGKPWPTLEDVDPPREKPDYQSGWHQLWTQFKRHLVAQHYADLARWVFEAGLAPAQILTSQTFLDARVATRINEPAETWSDEAGVSIEGAKPPHGHIGAILYGPGSRNEGISRTGESLLDNIRQVDPEWGLVEMHAGNIAAPHTLPTHLESYSSLLAITNYGATRFTPMWGSYAGDQRVHPEHFRSYDVFEQSPFETQFVWWMQSLRDQPWGGQIWPFGNAWVRSTDGWEAEAKTTLRATAPGQLELTGEGRVAMRSPSLRLTGKSWQLRVKGDWRAASAVAELVLDDEQRISVALDADAKARLLPPAGRTIRRIVLRWNGASKAVIDEVRIVPEEIGK